jgi:hypothetical protein
LTSPANQLAFGIDVGSTNGPSSAVTFRAERLGLQEACNDKVEDDEDQYGEEGPAFPSMLLKVFLFEPSWKIVPGAFAVPIATDE